MRELAVRRNDFPRSDFEPLRTALLSDSLVGATTLNGPFEASRGFAITFTARGAPKVAERLPALRPYLDHVLGEPAVRTLKRWLEPMPPLPNAFYLNVLVVPPGADVRRHVDATLAGPAGVDTARPVLVSVLYLVAPDTDGGELRLWLGDQLLTEVRPEEGMLLHFRGDLAHEVAPVAPREGLEPRASLVIEQYHFEPDALAKVPEYRLESKAAFAAKLREVAQRPPRTFDLE